MFLAKQESFDLSYIDSRPRGTKEVHAEVLQAGVMLEVAGVGRFNQRRLY
jgi:hypothetical protein